LILKLLIKTACKMIPFMEGFYLMKRTYLAGLFLMIPLFAFLMTGCSMLKPIYGDSFHASRSKLRNASNGDRSTLRLKVLAAPLINMAGLEDERAKILTETWATLLKEDPTLLVIPLTGSEESVSDTLSVETGIYTNPALIEKAEELGMNILVTSVLEPLHYAADKGIMWPFNKIKGEYDVSMIANAVDVITGTVIFTFKESEKIKMGEVPEGQNTSIPLDPEILDNVLHALQERLSLSMLDLLGERVWSGKISLDDGRIRIDGGTDIGITTGTLFDVFEKGDAVKSMTGRVYLVNGPKAGEIRVTDVLEDHSYAAPVGENVFETGQIITLKSE